MYRKGLTYDEYLVVLGINSFPSERIGYTLTLGTYEIIIGSQTLKHVEIIKVSDKPTYNLSLEWS